MEAKWSQSRVLPSAELAYETGLSAGSIAGTAARILVLQLRLIGFGDLGRSNNPVKSRRHAYFSGSRLWPSRDGEVPVFGQRAPLANLFVGGKWIRGVFSKLFVG
jgi:hypothetical protein